MTKKVKYKIVRDYYGNHPTRVIKTNLTLEQAQAHCRNPETRSKTCKLPENVKHTEEFGNWFDGYEEMK